MQKIRATNRVNGRVTNKATDRANDSAINRANDSATKRATGRATDRVATVPPATNRAATYSASRRATDGVFTERLKERLTVKLRTWPESEAKAKVGSEGEDEGELSYA